MEAQEGAQKVGARGVGKTIALGKSFWKANGNLIIRGDYKRLSARTATKTKVGLEAESHCS